MLPGHDAADPGSLFPIFCDDEPAAARTTCFDPSDPCTSYVNAERSNGQDH